MPGIATVRESRRQFPLFQMLSGISKKVVAARKQVIDQELDAKIPPLVRTGGFIPFVDHTVAQYDFLAPFLLVTEHK